MKKAKIIRHLKNMEWSGSIQGEGSYMGCYDGDWFSSCPVCGGLEEENIGFIEEVWGHRKLCWLSRAIKEN